MLDYTVFFPMLSTLTWDTLLTLRSTWGFSLNHLISLRPIKLKVSLIMFYLNMVDYLMSSLSLSP